MCGLVLAEDAMSRASAFFRAGIASYRAKDYGAAARAFLSAYQEKPSAQALYNAARAFGAGGDEAPALTLYAVALSTPNDLSRRQRVYARRVLAEKRDELAEIVVSGEGFVRLDPLVALPAPLTLFAEPGHHVVDIGQNRLSMDATLLVVKDSETVTITIPELSDTQNGEEGTRHVERGARAENPTPAQRDEPAGPDASTRNTHNKPPPQEMAGGPVWKNTPFILGASLTGAAFGTAVTLGTLTLQARDAFVEDGALSQSRRDKAVALRDATNIAWVACAVGAVATASYVIWGAYHGQSVPESVRARSKSTAVRTTWVASPAVLRGDDGRMVFGASVAHVF
jgi:hypothetical protein